MQRSPYRLLVLVVLVITVMVYIFETGHHVPVECSRSGFRAIYFGWDDNAGPCSYLQRVSFDLVYSLIFPVMIAWPMFVVWVLIHAVYLLKHRHVRPYSMYMLITPITGILIVWFIFMAIVQLFDNS